MRQKIISAIMQKLKKAGLKPYYHKKSKLGSTYIKFKTPTNGALRIANHPQRSCYAYRWNLRFDYQEKKTKEKGHTCYYYPLNCLDDLISALQTRIKQA